MNQTKFAFLFYLKFILTVTFKLICILNAKSHTPQTNYHTCKHTHIQSHTHTHSYTHLLTHINSNTHIHTNTQTVTHTHTLSLTLNFNLNDTRAPSPSPFHLNVLGSTPASPLPTVERQPKGRKYNFF